MFANALKSFSSNISSNYAVSSTPSSISGPWKIYDAKKKSTGKEVSVFVFDRKSLDAHTGGLGKSSASSFKRSVEEVVERLKKEASSLARLRHPNVLELVEPVEDTRNGGLQFATEAVTASLAGLLQEKNEQERAGGIGGRSSRHVVGDADSGRKRRREVEIDELEIQKGLLQISKALEFLHENAGLVHGNITPDAIYINAKSDWKISGLSFLSPPDNSNKPTSITPISLSEVLNSDPRLPKSVQLDLDYASPDFVLDSNLNTSADMFSLGLLIVALYNSPHASPLQSNASISTYKRLFTSSSTIPSTSNGFLSSQPMPKELTSSVLPRLIARRPAQRMTAREFQQSSYFDNILVSTIRFLDSLPAKTPPEKTQFMRGLVKVIPSFPKSVLEKKVLPALLDEMKDRELLALILQNIFKIIQLLTSGKRVFTEKISPRLREIFLASSNSKAGPPERDPAKESGLLVVLENMQIIAENCSGKEFHDEILPIIHLAIESPTHPIVDLALRSLPVVLPILDFSTIKNELFPVVASVFTKTSSLGIKVRGLEAFVLLCGGSPDGESSNDGLDGIGGGNKQKSATSALDKYTIQEKVIPLIRAIKTKEPAVMLAALKVLKQVGSVVDTELVAMEVLPILWNMSLGPLLNLQQFQSFMELIKSLSTRVEQDHTKKLQELAGSNTNGSSRGEDIMSFGGISAFSTSNSGADNAEDDFERLVQGKSSYAGVPAPEMKSGWDALPNNGPAQPARNSAASPEPAKFSWSTPSPTASTIPPSVLQPSNSRTITPDLSRFDALAPSKTQFSQPLQPTTPLYNAAPLQPQQQSAFQPPLQPQQTSLNWSMASSTASNPWASTPASPAPNSSMANLGASMSSMSMNQQRPMMTTAKSSFSLPPPPISPNNNFQNSAFQMPQQQNYSAFGGNTSMHQQPKPQAQKTGLDAWESLI